MLEVGWYSKRDPGGQLRRHWWKRSSRRVRSSQSSGRKGACGKPAVCRNSCSTVTPSFPLDANSGTMSATVSPMSRSPSWITSQPAAGGDGLGGREDAVERVVVGVAERLEQAQSPFPRDGDLHGRQEALVDFAAHAIRERAQPFRVEPDRAWVHDGFPIRHAFLPGQESLRPTTYQEGAAVENAIGPAASVEWRAFGQGEQDGYAQRLRRGRSATHPSSALPTSARRPAARYSARRSS